MRDACGNEVALKDLVGEVKLGAQLFCQLLHMRENVIGIFEVAHVAELIELIKADGLRGKNGQNLLEVLGGSCHNGNACAREGNF